MKRSLSVILIFVMAMMLLCSCTKKADDSEEFSDKYSVEFSDKYLVGFWEENEPFTEPDFWNGLSVEVRICFDGTVEIYMPAVVDYKIMDKELIGSYQLTQEEINTLTEVVKQKELYDLDPEEDYEILDGNERMLYLYDKDGNMLKECGGYMPGNETFKEMFKAVRNVLDFEEHGRIIGEWIEIQKRG